MNLQTTKKPAHQHYICPKLISYGHVRDLTQSGPTGIAEPPNAGNGSPQKKA